MVTNGTSLKKYMFTDNLKIWNVLNDGLINKNLPDNVPVCGNRPTTTNVNLPVKAVN